MTIITGRISIAGTTKYVEKISDTVTSFSVAEDRTKSKDKPKVKFWRISKFGKTGKALQPYLQTGRIVTIEGDAEDGCYINKEGKPVSYLYMVNPKVKFLDGMKHEDPTVAIPDEIVVEEEDTDDVGDEPL